jgi:hydrogenase-4 component F
VETALLLLAIPLVAAGIQGVVGVGRAGRLINLGAGAGTFAAAIALAVERPALGGGLILDELNLVFVLLTAFVGLTTAWYSAGYVAGEVAAGRMTPRRERLYHAMVQLFLFAVLLALLADNLGLVWVAIEGATLATVLTVGLYRTAAAIEAAWKYFILAGVGIALALFGTILVYMAATPVMGTGSAAMTWSLLRLFIAEADPQVMTLAFVFVLVGYGTKAGLVPLHAWLPDAHAEGPTPLSAVLSGLLLNVALYAILRFRALVEAGEPTVLPGALMMAMGLASVLVGGLMLHRRRDARRFFAFSSVEHMGIAAFALGFGGPLATFAGLLHMVLHTLTKSAVFFAVGSAAQAAGSQRIEDLTGLLVGRPALGWGLLAGVIAIAGLPPFGLFATEVMIVAAAFPALPWLVPFLCAGLLVALGALVVRVQGMVLGPAGPASAAARAPASLGPMWIHLALVLLAGVWLPEPVRLVLEAAADLIAGAR